MVETMPGSWYLLKMLGLITIVVDNSNDHSKGIKPVNPKGNQPWLHWKNWCRRSNILAIWCEELIHYKRPWCWERLKTWGKEGDRGWDDCMASSTPRTWVWANSRRQWRTGKPGMLQSMGFQRVGHDLATEQQQQKWKKSRRSRGKWRGKKKRNNNGKLLSVALIFIFHASKNCDQ